MAVDFTQGLSSSDTYLAVGSPVRTVVPMTMGCRFLVPSGPPSPRKLITLSSPSAGYGLVIEALSGGGRVNAHKSTPLLNFGNAYSPGPYSLNVFHTGVAVWASNASAFAYLDGVAGAEDTINFTVNPAFIDNTYIGTDWDGHQFFGGFTGCLDDVFIDSVAWTAGQIAAYNAGARSWKLSPSAMALNLPLLSAATRTINLAGAPVTSNTGAGSFADCSSAPPRISPSDFQMAAPTVVVPPTPTPSSTVYYIERMDNRIWPTIEDAWCLDAALAYPMPTPAATLSADSATGDGAIRTYNLINGGSGYTSPIAQIVDLLGSGSGATVQLSVVGGVITAASAITIGADYVRPELTVLDTTGAGAVIQPIVTNYAQFDASAGVFTDSNIGDIIRMGGGKAQVVTRLSSASVVGNIIVPITTVVPNDPNNTPVPAVSGSWTMTTPTTSVRGLDHLEGMVVYALADGGVVRNLTVVNGAVTLSVSASQILVGLTYAAQLQTMYLEAGGGQTLQTRRKDGTQVVVRVENSSAPEVGMNQPDAAALPNQANVPWTGMTFVPSRTPAVPAGQAVPLFSGDLPITNLFTTWDAKGQIAVQQLDPVPLTVTALIPWVAVGDQPSGS